jgi:hypothetical protein
MADYSKQTEAATELRTVQFSGDGPRVPMELVRLRDAGEVVFVVGAGVSKGAGLPLFWELTRDVYLELVGADPADPNTVPHAEHRAYEEAAYDVALGLLEGRLDDGATMAGPVPRRRVREAVAAALKADKATRIDRHRDLLMLSRDLRG